MASIALANALTYLDSHFTVFDVLSANNFDPEIICHFLYSINANDERELILGLNIITMFILNNVSFKYIPDIILKKFNLNLCAAFYDNTTLSKRICNIKDKIELSDVV